MTTAALGTTAPRLVSFLIPLAVCAASVPSGVRFWDTGELQTVPYILGIAHPCGFPVFVLAGWAFTHALPFGTVAWRVGVMCAIAMAFAALLLAETAVELGAGRWAAAGGALLFAVGETTWTDGSRAEVHAFTAAFSALILLLAVRWWKRPAPGRLGAIALALGFALATHPLTLLLTPGLLLLVALRFHGHLVASSRSAADGVAETSTGADGAVAGDVPPGAPGGIGGRRVGSARLTADWSPLANLRAAALVVVGLLLYLYLPLRSAWVTAHGLDPTLALGIPPGRPYWDYDHPASLAGFLAETTGSQFSVGGGLLALVSPARYLPVLAAWSAALGHESGPVAIVLALLGLAELVRREWRLAAGLALAAGLGVAFAFSYTSESDVSRYLLASYAFAALLAALGATVLGDRVLAARPAGAPIGRRLAAGVMLATALSVALPNLHLFADRNDDSAQRFVDRVVALTPDDAVIVSEWLYATPLAYAAYVEHRLGHRVVETAWPAEDAPLIERWAHGRPVYVIARERIAMPAVRLEVASDQYPLILHAHAERR